ncbi:hypothetical protein N431DRAFT_459976 [Stipitochalara longipes BDJ]|nr:hypothetical protein N431DRAFT_459976 [Stipitochalara longipes BDJ]
MRFSPVKFFLAIVAFFFLFTFTSTTPVAALTTPNTTIDTRQESGGIYYGDACSGGEIGEWECMLTISSKTINEGQSNQYYWSTLFIFYGGGCDLIGYIPGVNIENNWVSMDSQLPDTVDIVSHGGNPMFNYQGTSYTSPNNQWSENDGGFNVVNWQYYFYCPPS